MKMWTKSATLKTDWETARSQFAHNSGEIWDVVEASESGPELKLCAEALDVDF